MELVTVPIWMVPRLAVRGYQEKMGALTHELRDVLENLMFYDIDPRPLGDIIVNQMQQLILELQALDFNFDFEYDEHSFNDAYKRFESIVAEFGSEYEDDWNIWPHRIWGIWHTMIVTT